MGLWLSGIILFLITDMLVWWWLSPMPQRKSQSTATPIISLNTNHTELESDEAVFNRYAGAVSCRNCHREELASWENSNHALAERPIEPSLDRAAFDPPRTVLRGTDQARVQIQNGKYEVTTAGLANTQQTFIVQRVIGRDPLRQFLVPFPDGRLQTLAASYDPRSNEWFNVFGGEGRKPGEWGHWTGRGMNWNSMCAACHNTRVRKNYNAATDSYNTQMAEATVSCEACHGPLKAHNEWQQKFGKSGATDPTITKMSGTVSKVLNGRADVAATPARIEDLLERHDYVGRRIAAGSRTAVHPAVELVLDAELNAYATEIVQGVLDAGAQAGVAVSLAVRGRRSAVSAHPVTWARDLAAAGRRAVIGVVNSLTTGHVGALSRARLPLVVIDPIGLPRASVTSVGATNFAGGLAATQPLSLGHQRVAYVGGSPVAACNQARLQGFRAAMDAAELAVPDGYVRPGTFRFEDGVVGGAAMLDLPHPPTAVFAACDEVAVGVVEAARVRGLGCRRTSAWSGSTTPSSPATPHPR